MTKFICQRFAAIALFLLLALPSFAGAMEDLRGKWTLNRTNENGVAVSQTLEIKDNKFTFEVVGPDKKIVLYARGEVKVETVHSLNLALFTNIEGGRDKDDINPVDDDRSCVFYVDGTTLSIAIDFDKDRNKSPRVEAYTKN